MEAWHSSSLMFNQPRVLHPVCNKVAIYTPGLYVVLAVSRLGFSFVGVDLYKCMVLQDLKVLTMPPKSENMFL